MPIHYKDDACVPTNSIENYNVKWLNLSFIPLQLWYHIDISTSDINSKYWKNPIRVKKINIGKNKEKETHLFHQANYKQRAPFFTLQNPRITFAWRNVLSPCV